MTVPEDSTKDSLRLLTWNINGLKQKLKDEKLRNFLKQYDVIGLQETWGEEKDEFAAWLPGYKAFVKAGQRTSKYGHCSGGVIVFVKDTLADSVVELKTGNEFCIFLQFKREVFNLDRNVLLGFVYIPPENSKVYETKI